jgi:hypothetical protein
MHDHKIHPFHSVRISEFGGRWRLGRFQRAKLYSVSQIYTSYCTINQSNVHLEVANKAFEAF